MRGATCSSMSQRSWSVSMSPSTSGALGAPGVANSPARVFTWSTVASMGAFTTRRSARASASATLARASRRPASARATPALAESRRAAATRSSERLAARSSADTARGSLIAFQRARVSAMRARSAVEAARAARAEARSASAAATAARRETRAACRSVSSSRRRGVPALTLSQTLTSTDFTRAGTGTPSAVFSRTASTRAAAAMARAPGFTAGATGGGRTGLSGRALAASNPAETMPASARARRRRRDMGGVEI